MRAGEDGLEFLRRALSSLKVYQAENISRYGRLCMDDLELIRLPEQKVSSSVALLRRRRFVEVSIWRAHIQPLLDRPYVLSLQRLNPTSVISKTSLSVPSRQITSALI